MRIEQRERGAPGNGIGKRNGYSYGKVSAGYDISISSSSENSEHALSNHKNGCRFKCRHICGIFLIL